MTSVWTAGAAATPASAQSVAGGHGLHVVQALAFLAVSLVVVKLTDRHPGGGRPEPLRLDVAGSRRLRWLAALASAGCALIHFAVTPEHLTEDVWFGCFFLAAGSLQLGYAMALVRRPSLALVRAGVSANVGALALWLVSRTVGLPVGPASGRPEAVGVLDLAASVLEAAVVVGGALVLAGPILEARRAALQSEPELIDR